MGSIRTIFSKNLKRLRNKKGYSQEELAEMLGITARYVQQLEGAKCPDVKIETIAALAKALKAKPKDFLED